MKLLYVTSLSGKRINSFMRSAIEAAKELGIDFTLACNTNMADKEYKTDCDKYGIELIHIPFERNPLSPINIKAYNQLTKLMRAKRFDVVHCNTPIGGVIGRLCAHKEKVPFVIYQAHGFHFWKNAPIRNWLVYYPIERFLSRYCDRLVTINHEDYNLAKSFKLKEGGKCIYIPGVGIDLDAINKDTGDTNYDFNSIQDKFKFITTGRLDKNKNINTIINAFAKTEQTDAVLLICGDGEERNNLESMISDNNIKVDIEFLGFRDDVIGLLKNSDCFVFASFREGLSASLMEAIAAGIPCIASRIRGNTDLLPDSELLFNPNDTNELAQKMLLVRNDDIVKREIESASKNIQQFGFDEVVKQLKELYCSAGLAQ